MKQLRASTRHIAAAVVLAGSSAAAFADGGPCVSRGVGPYQRASLYNKCTEPRVATLNYVLIQSGQGATYYCLVRPKKKRLIDISTASVVTVLDDSPKDNNSPPDSNVCRPPNEQ